MTDLTPAPRSARSHANGGASGVTPFAKPGRHRAPGDPDKGRSILRDAVYSPDPRLRPQPRHRAEGGTR